MSKFILKINGLEFEVYPKHSNSDLQKIIEVEQQFLRGKWIELSFIDDEFLYIYNASISSLFEIEYFDLINGNYISFIKGKFTKVDCVIDVSNKSAVVTPTTVDSYTKLTEGINVKQNIIGKVSATSGIKYDLPPILQLYSSGSNKVTNVVGNTHWDSEVNLVIDTDSQGNTLADYGFGSAVLQIFISGVGDGVVPDVTGEYFDVFLSNESNVYQKGIYQLRGYGLTNLSLPNIGLQPIPIVSGNDLDDQLGYIGLTIPNGTLTDLDFDSVWQFTTLSSPFTIDCRYIGFEDDIYYFKYAFDFDNQETIAPSGTITHVSGGVVTANQVYTEWVANPNDPSFRWTIYDTNLSQYIYLGEMNVPLHSTPTFQEGSVLTSISSGDQVKCLANVVHCRYIFKDLEEIQIQTGVGLIVGETVDILEEDILPQNENYNKSYPLNIGVENLEPSDLNSDEDQGYGLFSEDALHFPSKYFVRPSSNQIPINSEEWTEQSLWFNHTVTSLSIWELNKVEVTLNHAYSLSSVINALIILSDEDLSHDQSDFFYGLANTIRGTKRDVYLVPKSNIITANYDRPASKAELSIKELFDALRIIYNTYYYIENNKLILEHLAYFENGKRYDGQNIGVDVTNILNPRANKNISNNVFSYEKFNLPEYQNYNWMDEVSDYFDSFSIQTLENYVNKGDIKDFNTNLFTSDLDFILSNPSAITKNGFVILETIDKKVAYDNDVQNGYLAFKYLLPNYHRYGMSGRNVVVAGEDLEALSILKTKKEEVYIPDTYTIDENRLITTDLGIGQVKSVTRTIGDLQTKIEVLHETES